MHAKEARVLFPCSIYVYVHYDLFFVAFILSFIFTSNICSAKFRKCRSHMCIVNVSAELMYSGVGTASYLGF